MTHHEPIPHQEPEMTTGHDLSSEPRTEPRELLLEFPGQAGHETHPAIQFDTAAGPWLCLGHRTDEIHAAHQEGIRQGLFTEDSGICEADGLGTWRPIAGDTFESCLQVAKGITAYGPGYAVWADIMDDPDTCESFADCFDGIYRSCADWGRHAYGDAIEPALDAALPPELRSAVTVDYYQLAQWATEQGHIMLLPVGGQIYAFKPEPDAGP